MRVVLTLGGFILTPAFALDATSINSWNFGCWKASSGYQCVSKCGYRIPEHIPGQLQLATHAQPVGKAHPNMGAQLLLVLLY